MARSEIKSITRYVNILDCNPNVTMPHYNLHHADIIPVRN